MNRLGDLIQRTLEMRGYRTQREFATALGWDASRVSRMIGGTTKTLPSPEEMAAVSDVLGLSMAEMLEAAGYRVVDVPDNPEPHAVTEIAEHARIVDWERDASRLSVMHAILSTWAEFDRNSLRAVAEASPGYDE